MDFGVLGSLSVTERARVVALGGPVQRRLLAALISHAPQPVSSETLVDDVWGEAAPATAVRTLHSHVARLRDALGRDSAHAIQTIDGRYLLPLSRTDVDAWVFEDLVLAATSDGLGALEVSAELHRALDLWRGPAYGEFAGAPFADAESRRLESLREQALEAAIYADLAAGKGAELVPDLESLVIEHPFRERMWSALVVALYRAGRQGDALDAYQRARSLLGDELGVDPGPELRAVEAKVLAQDPSLMAAAPTRMPTCPWKGLSTYEPGDADFFVGRDAVVSEVIARLVDYSVVIITGPSGSGKSSLVRAGVIPALREGAIIGSGDWRVTLLSPGTRPLDAVRTALSEASSLLVIDPGDDLLTVSSSDEVGPIAEELRDGIARGLRVVLTLRGDLYGRLTELNSLAPRAGAGTVLVGPPSDEELAQVVDLPARRVGLDVDPALVRAVISDVGGRPAALPLLSTALVRTWERREGGRLTLAGYIAAGGTSSALERLAEEAYAAMRDEERVAARRILLRLVVSDDGLWRRRRVSIAEVVPEGDEASGRALFSLSDNRLVSLDVGEVQLSHEALTSAWPRFADWLAEREQSAGVFEHLTTSARAWQAGGRDDGDLYRGARLQAALDLEASQPDELGTNEHEFIARSRSAGEQEITRLRRGRRRLVFVAAGLVILLALASVAGALAVRSRDEAAAAAVQADAQRVGLQALTRTDVAQKLLLAVAAVGLDDSAGTKSSLLTALQDAGGAATTVPLAAPATAVSVSSEGWIAVAESNGHVEVFSPALDFPDVIELATLWTRGTPTGAVAWLDGNDSMLFGAADPSRVFSFPLGGWDGVSSFGTGWNPYVFGATGDHAWGVGTSTSPDAHGGATLLARRASSASSARNAGNAAKSVSVELSGPPIAIVPGPGASVTVIERGLIERVDVALATVTSRTPMATAGVVVASTDGRHVATAGADGTVTLVDLQRGASREPIPRLDAPLAKLALSSDGLRLAGTAARDSTIHVWSTATGVELATFRSNLGDVGAMGWSPDGQHLFTTATAVAALQDWDLSRTASPTDPKVAQGPPGSGLVTATAVSPETSTLAVGTDQGRPWFLDLDSGRVSSSTGQPVTTSQKPAVTPIASIAFAEHGSVALTADAYGVLALWDPATGELLANLTRATRVDTATDVSRAPVSPDGRRAASFVDGFGLRLVDLDRRTVGRPVYPDLGLPTMNRVLGWSADGQHVIVGAEGSSFGSTDSPPVWALVDPRTGRVLWRTEAPEEVVAADVVNADGGRTIVVPGASGRLYFLDASSGALIGPTAANTGRAPAVNDRRTPASLSVNPNGQQLSVVSAAHPVEIWDVASGEQSGTIEVPGSTIAAHFRSDHQLVTTTVGGAVSVIHLSVSDWIDLACRGAGRELSPREWSQFLPTYPYRQVCAAKPGAPT